ncbi:MAG: NAD-dependent deacylase [Gemmatimonadaceae bacterium]
MSASAVLAESLARSAGFLRAATSVVVFTGAGVSAESGIPTYRSGSDGLWSRQNMERFANPRGYAANLPDSYEWYRARARGISEVQPNAAHIAIAQLASRVPRLSVVTQNIDSLHQRAGSRDVVELHGSLRDFRCDDCEKAIGWESLPDLAVCVSCGGMLRPGVVMFEEYLPDEALERARHAAATCNVLLSVGTSNQVWPAAELPGITLHAGGTVVIVNPDLRDQAFHRSVLGIPLPAGEALPRMLQLIEEASEAATAAMRV